MIAWARTSIAGEQCELHDIGQSGADRVTEDRGSNEHPGGADRKRSDGKHHNR